jgi:beta-glucosidase
VAHDEDVTRAENIDERIAELLATLTLDEKVRLLTGRDFWTTWPIEKIGLRRLLFSDGPSGVRGEVWDERDPSVNLPSATALSSSWDPTVAYRYGVVAALEARRKGVDGVLGPTINLHRSPYGGRHFEAFSEDPVLTAVLAAAYVSGVQDNGVGATPKHYIANDFETDRFTVDVQVGERALRELYLLAFEKAVVEARAWLVMSSYNSVNGTTVSESELLETPLNSEWGFDGVVVSDWTAVRSLASASASQDLAMPGPVGPWGDALTAAVRDGSIDESVVDRKVLRILRLAARVGALDGFEPAATSASSSSSSSTPSSSAPEDGIAFAREASAAGTVLLANDGILPLGSDATGATDGPPSSIAVIGHNARFARTQGGGSATVVPAQVISPLDGIREALPNSGVTYSVGAVVQEGVSELPIENLTNPQTSEPGLRVRFLAADGDELSVEDRRSTALVWFGGDAPIAAAATLELTTDYTPDATESIRLGFASVGHARIWADDRLVLDETLLPEGDDLGAAFLAPPSTSAPLELVEGEPVRIRIELDLADRTGPLAGALAFTFGFEPDDSDPDALIAEAAAAAGAAEVAIVVVGTNSRVESEGYDRTTLALPGRQDELVRAVVAANPRTVVVINAGSPVLLPWRNEVAAILLSYFGGQEMGHALADVLTGIREPGGRLPTTWPATEADVPVADVTPVDGVVRYDEGIHIGYRAWLKSGNTPAYPFGHGLGYTTIEPTRIDAPNAASAGEPVTVSVTVTNHGARRGKQVVQAYLRRAESAVDRPVLWLAAFAPVVVDAGGSATVELSIDARAFAYWGSAGQDADRAGGWQYEPGDYELLVGTSVDKLPLSRTIMLG